MHEIIEVKPLSNYRVWIKFSDGVEGTVDLSELVGEGVFKAWEDIEFFNSVYIDPESHTIAWKGGIDLCPDNLYAKVLGVEPLSILKKELVVNY
ncbi:DUF2442 domain-containing protein [Patescibacteria group bacterium]|jgi:hypothetical protein|nr:DUF2442 domain-containing protein [Patescibacteria group bacterium]